MLQYLIPSCIGCITLLFFGISYKFVSDFSNSASFNKVLITMLTLTMTLLSTLL